MKLRRRPRILYFSPYWPHRATCASELRALHVARALAQIGTVDVVVIDGEGKREDWFQQSNHEFAVAAHVTVHDLKKRTAAQKLRWLVDPRMLYPHGCGVDDESTLNVVRMAAEYDLVWFCKMRTPNLFPQWAWPRSVADIDDVPSMFERSVCKNTHGLAESFFARARLMSWTKRDKVLGERFSVLGVCSEADKEYVRRLGVRAPLHVIPNGFERPMSVPVRELVSPARLGFIGIFDYVPNRQGIEWFVNHCWPLIQREVPDARLRLVGRHSDDELAPKGPGIDGLGWVADPTQEMATWSAMVVPIHTGGGTRGKIAHAFSAKCPVVSTPLGAYGYEVVDGREMFLAQSASDYAAACVRAIRQPEEASAMAERAWQLFLTRWSWEAISPSVWAAAEDCLRRSGWPGHLSLPTNAVADPATGTR